MRTHSKEGNSRDLVNTEKVLQLKDDITLMDFKWYGREFR